MGKVDIDLQLISAIVTYLTLLLSLDSTPADLKRLLNNRLLGNRTMEIFYMKDE